MIGLYFIAILPTPDLSNEIDKIRRACSFEYQVYSALKPPVHITLIPPFKLKSTMEPGLISTLKNHCNFQSFIQKLENFDGFPEHTIYINALKSAKLSELHLKLLTVLKHYCNYRSGSINPHITIAYRDAERAYTQIMEQYRSKSFKAEFLVTHFTLLKHDGQRWNVLNDFYAGNNDAQLKISL